MKRGKVRNGAGAPGWSPVDLDGQEILDRPMKVTPLKYTVKAQNFHQLVEPA